ncbi:MAG: leucine-rich repeat domain-containing protein [Paracoccaceae bacterium]|nr:MAG: leucine-rich repeat domain-containing protein [Paracoccaceae bacterium]
MTPADQAHAEAERLIAQARERGATRLTLSGHSTDALYPLDRIPDSIATLPALAALDLSFTRVTDLSPLATLSALTTLSLPDTRVTDLSPLATLPALATLDLSHAQVTDLSPLATLPALATLILLGTQVTDLSPLATLPALASLDLSGTQVTDLSPLATLPALATLDLSRTQVTDLSPLGNLPALTTLTLSGTQVTDLSPLATLPALATLSLAGTKVTDLSPLATLLALTTLFLSGTRVTDLSPISGLTGLTRLDLAGTPVTRDGLRHLARLQRLVTHPGPADRRPKHKGLRIAYCAAAREDRRIAEIADIEEPGERARALFDYLAMPVGGDAGAPDPDPVPPRRPAPLEIVVTDTAIRRAGAAGLPQSDANARAALGWAALRDHRQGFSRAFSVHNYQPLPAYLQDFDAAMGDAYDPARVIAIGVQGQRLLALSRNASFCGMLPIGADTDFVAFAAAIDLYVRRFPDWVAYRDEADPDDLSPEAARAARADLREIEGILARTPEAAEDVKQEYRSEVEAAIGDRPDEAAAKAVIASTGEVARALAERGTEDIARKRRNADLARKGGDYVDRNFVAPLGLPLHVMKRMEAPLRRLSRRFPNRLGWIDRWYDATFPPDPPPNP